MAAIIFIVANWFCRGRRITEASEANKKVLLSIPSPDFQVSLCKAKPLLSNKLERRQFLLADNRQNIALEPIIRVQRLHELHQTGGIGRHYRVGVGTQIIGQVMSRAKS